MFIRRIGLQSGPRNKLTAPLLLIIGAPGGHRIQWHRLLVWSSPITGLFFDLQSSWDCFAFFLLSKKGDFRTIFFQSSANCIFFLQRVSYKLGLRGSLTDQLGIFFRESHDFFSISTNGPPIILLIGLGFLTFSLRSGCGFFCVSKVDPRILYVCCCQHPAFIALSPPHDYPPPFFGVPLQETFPKFEGKGFFFEIMGVLHKKSFYPLLRATP